MSSDDTRRLIPARRARFIQLGLGLTLAGTSGSFLSFELKSPARVIPGSRMWFGGKGGGVPQALLQGKVDRPKAVLPPGADALAPAFEKCKNELGVSP